MLKVKAAGWLGLLVAISMLGFLPSARANTVNFDCVAPGSGSPFCSGTVVQNGSNFKNGSGGITVWDLNGPYSMFTAFKLTFDTSNKSIQISDGTNTLVGTFASFSSSTGFSTMAVTLAGTVWPTLPVAVQNQLGTPTGLDITSITFLISGGVVTNVSVTITPTPEPGTLALFGSGLLVFGGALRRKIGAWVSR